MYFDQGFEELKSHHNSDPLLREYLQLRPISGYEAVELEVVLVPGTKLTD